MPKDVRYLVHEGYYVKEKFVTGVTDESLHFIEKLRSDANLRYFYKGPRREGRVEADIHDTRKLRKTAL
ncbi:Uncharacterized protein dnm_034550 [Desulfonema magnum]|uniref:Uncharacterized protein n=1 Tax=Desulfonema magnum TaxID=45655 RepID=A0A975BLD5_9BACT|nr:Uncharacterized protein dnm_034550 [Desulfonema magnum]